MSEERMEEILLRSVEIVALEESEPVLLCFLHRNYLNNVQKITKQF